MRYFLVFICVVLFGCKSEENFHIDENIFRNKTYKFEYKSSKDELIQGHNYIEFSDSTYKGLVRMNGTQKWKVSEFDNASILFLAETAIRIQQLNDSVFHGQNLRHEDISYKITLDNTSWSREDFVGKWVLEKYYKTTKDFWPLPPAPINDSIYRTTEWPPFYKISKNKLISNYFFESESEYKINNSNRFIEMKLTNHDIGKIENQWKIKSINDSVMIVNRRFLDYENLSSNEIDTKDIKLFKIN